jgi:hypothetical protein
LKLNGIRSTSLNVDVRYAPKNTASTHWIGNPIDYSDDDDVVVDDDDDDLY